MSEPFTIATIPAPDGGKLGLCPLPGRTGALQADLDAIAAWKPDLVVSLTSTDEMQAAGVGALHELLTARQLEWRHLPIPDFGIPNGSSADRWPDLEARIHTILDRGGNVLVHCMGGKGRSGMIVYRLLIERREAAAKALTRLRAARPGAVETPEQACWAEAGR